MVCSDHLTYISMCILHIKHHARRTLQPIPYSNPVSTGFSHWAVDDLLFVHQKAMEVLLSLGLCLCFLLSFMRLEGQNLNANCSTHRTLCIGLAFFLLLLFPFLSLSISSLSAAGYGTFEFQTRGVASVKHDFFQKQQINLTSPPSPHSASNVPWSPYPAAFSNPF